MERLFRYRGLVCGGGWVELRVGIRGCWWNDALGKVRFCTLLFCLSF